MSRQSSGAAFGCCAGAGARVTFARDVGPIIGDQRKAAAGERDGERGLAGAGNSREEETAAIAIEARAVERTITPMVVPMTPMVMGSQ